MTLEINTELERRIKREAARLGVAPDAYAARVLDQAVPGVRVLRSGRELVEYWEREGVLGAWAHRDDIGDSADYARELRRQAETRSREG